MTAVKNESLANSITLEFSGSKEIYPNMKVEKLLDKWLKYKKEYITPSTYASFDLSIENHIKPYFSGYKICDINEGVIQSFVDHLHTDGKLDGSGGFALKTLRNLILPLQMALEYARKYKAVEALEWDSIEMPRERREDKVKAMTFEEQRNLVQACYLDLNPKTCAYMITIFTGLRIGEICGLQMKDISLEQKTISVNKTIQRIYSKSRGKSHMNVGQTKTENSYRTIPFPERLVPVIAQFYDKDRPENYFITQSRKPTEPRTLRQAYERFLKRNNLPKYKFHELRHTFATRAIEMPEFDIKSLSAILGHKNPAFTLNMYGRPNLDQEEKCMKLMNQLV